MTLVTDVQESSGSLPHRPQTFLKTSGCRTNPMDARGCRPRLTLSDTHPKYRLNQSPRYKSNKKRVLGSKAYSHETSGVAFRWPKKHVAKRTCAHDAHEHVHTNMCICTCAYLHVHMFVCTCSCAHEHVHTNMCTRNVS